MKLHWPHIQPRSSRAPGGAAAPAAVNLRPWAQLTVAEQAQRLARVFEGFQPTREQVYAFQWLAARPPPPELGDFRTGQGCCYDDEVANLAAVAAGTKPAALVDARTTQLPLGRELTRLCLQRPGSAVEATLRPDDAPEQVAVGRAAEVRALVLAYRGSQARGRFTPDDKRSIGLALGYPAVAVEDYVQRRYGGTTLER